MKRWIQKLISVLMCMTLVLSLGVTAFAGDEEADVAEPKPAQEQSEDLEKKLLEEQKRKEEEERRRKEAAAKEAAEKEAAAKEAAAKEAAAKEAAAKEAAAKEAAAKEAAAKEAAAKEAAEKEAAAKEAAAKEAAAEEAAEKEAAAEEAAAEEVVPAKDDPPTKEDPPAKETTEDDVPDDVASKQETKEVVKEEESDRQLQNEDNDKSAVTADKVEQQKEELAEKTEAGQEKADPQVAEDSVTDVKQSKPEAVAEKTGADELSKPEENNKPDKDKAVKSDESGKQTESVVANADTGTDEQPLVEDTCVIEKALPQDQGTLPADSTPKYSPDNIFASTLPKFMNQLDGISQRDNETDDTLDALDETQQQNPEDIKENPTPRLLMKAANNLMAAQANPDGSDDTDNGTNNDADSAARSLTAGSAAAAGTTASGDTTAAASAAASGSTAAKDAKTVVTVDGTEYSNKDVAYNPDLIEDKDANPKLKGIGWVAEDGTLQLTNEDIKELVVKEGDLTIQAAGFNHINNLVTDSVVSIIGTGIILLDDVDLKDDGEVKLTENKMYADTGVTGSVAVFLKDKNADKANTYRLINAGIPGILDEAYTIPKGYNLIIPSGESIIMNSTVAAPKEDGTGYTYYSSEDAPSTLTASDVLENSALLKISDGASLTVEEGASVKMISTESVKAKGEAVHILTPILEIENGGKLVQKGKLTGTGGMVVSDENDFVAVAVVGSVKAPAITVKDTDELYDELKKNHNVGDTISFDDLKAAWDSMHPGKPTDENAVFVFRYKGEDGNWHTAYISKESGETVKFPGSASDWSKGSYGNPYSGLGLTSHQLGATGSGIIEDMGSNKKLTFPAGSSKTILPIAAETNLWRVIVTENPKRDTWTLSVWYGDTQIFDLGVMTVRARFKFDLPEDWDGKNIYAVFLDKKGDLRAFPAKYYAATGELVFDSNLVGEFVIVNFDYKGELYSRDFYDELAKLDEVKHLVDLYSGRTK